ncbi:hypothetical protein PG993_000203 [Apiospora rasikravindrae]|uniref:MYND-type domain-containing protein n=1 Tax=Apiospora rasikravindrae TaxID=990691 RepID=A0ABR1U7V3_9PEZI
MDSVERLFRAFPDPKSDDRDTRSHGPTDAQMDKFNAPLKAFLKTTSVDPDFTYLKEQAEKAIGDPGEKQRFRHAIVHLSLSKAEIPDDGSAKSKQLRYHRWIGLGRKDSDRPFPPTATITKDDASLAYLPAALMNPQACATCGEKSTDACVGCKLVYGTDHVVFKTVYCSKKCQKDDWPRHKASCLSRKLVQRAVIILRELFILYKSLNCTFPAERIVEKGGVLCNYLAPSAEAAHVGDTVPTQFPIHLAASDDILRACVTDCYGSFEALETFKGVFDLFLEPICTQIREAGILPRNAHRPTMTISPAAMLSNMLPMHFVLRAQLHSGEEVAIDVAGSHFGWNEPVSPWNHWESQRAYHSCMFSYGTVCFEMGLVPPPSLDMKIRQFRKKQVTAMLGAINYVIQRQQPGKSRSITRLLNSPNYLELKGEITTAARQALRAGIAQLQASKTMRLYFTGNWVTDLTATKEESEVLDKVWLSREEYQKNKHDPELLQAIWMKRCRDKEVAKDARKLGLKLLPDNAGGEGTSGQASFSDDVASEAAYLSQFANVIVDDGRQLTTLYRSGGTGSVDPTMQALIDRMARKRSGGS